MTIIAILFWSAVALVLTALVAAGWLIPQARNTPVDTTPWKPGGE